MINIEENSKKLIIKSDLSKPHMTLVYNNVFSHDLNRIHATSSFYDKFFANFFNIDY